MNVLLSCAGRRNYLIDYFRAAGADRIVATDASPFAPAMGEVDNATVVPLISDPDYLKTVLDLCAAERVDLLISLNDLELPLLAANRERFERVGTRVVVSAPEVIDLCFDKLATVQFLQKHGIPAPLTFSTLGESLAAIDEGRLRFPLVLKPRWGTASIGIEFLETRDQLVEVYDAVRRRVLNSIVGAESSRDEQRCMLIQEMLPGKEHGLDIVNDLDGRYAATFAKQKLAMRAGETDRAITLFDDRLEALGRAIGTATGHVGNLDCDVFLDEGRGPVVLELNPRFGGGYPFSHTAGADVPSALIAWARGETPDPRWMKMRGGVASAKCDRLVVTSDASAAL